MKLIKKQTFKILLIIISIFQIHLFASNSIEGSLCEMFIEKNNLVFDFYIHEDFLKSLPNLSYLKDQPNIIDEISSKKDLIYKEITNLFSIFVDKKKVDFKINNFIRQEPYYIAFSCSLSNFNYDLFKKIDLNYLYPLSSDKKDNLCLIVHNHGTIPFTTDIGFLHETRKGLIITKEEIKNCNIDFINYKTLYLKIFLLLLAFFIILKIPVIQTSLKRT